MNKSILEFLEEEYDYVNTEQFNLTEEQLESLLIHMAEDSVSTFTQHLFSHLEGSVGFIALSEAISAATEETMSHYHGVDV